MTIPKKILTKWEILRSPGDSNELAKRLPGSAPETFNRTFRSGKCRDEVFQVMTTFYADKSEMVRKALTA